VTVPAATIRAMPGDLEPLPMRVSPAAAAGSAVLAAELLAGCGRSSPAVSELGERGAGPGVRVR